MASFKCKDMGMKCDFEIKDENKQEMMAMINLHAENTHKLKEMPPEMAERMMQVIKD